MAQGEIARGVEEARLACTVPAEMGDMSYPYGDASPKAKYMTDSRGM